MQSSSPSDFANGTGAPKVISNRAGKSAHLAVSARVQVRRQAESLPREEGVISEHIALHMRHHSLHILERVNLLPSAVAKAGKEHIGTKHSCTVAVERHNSCLGHCVCSPQTASDTARAEEQGHLRCHRGAQIAFRHKDKPL